MGKTTYKGAITLTIQLIQYPKCTTCRKAKAWLTAQGIEFEDIHIVEQTPTADELRAFHEVSGLPLKKFFNTSGQKYRELGLKDTLANMSEEDMYKLLASDGMLIKRPLVTDGKTVTLGFKEADFEAAWK